MRFVVVAHRCSETNLALAAAAEAVGIGAAVLPPRDALRILEPGDGALAQELVPPLGWDLRIVVAGGRVVGAARRVAAPGEWRTNVALGGHSEPMSPPPLACSLALSAAAAVRGDLVGVDLLPTKNGFVISEVNGAVDFHPYYALDTEDVFTEAVLELLRAARDRRAVELVGA